MSKITVGIDIGGTNTAIGMVDRDGSVLFEQIPQLPTPQKKENYDLSQARSEEILEKYTDTLVAKIKEAIDSVKQTTPDIEVAGIGIGAPNGNYYKGTIELAPNLPFVGVVQFTDMIKSKIPEIEIIKLTNDANAAALGEMIYGGGNGMKNFMMITLGTGVGSGLIVNGDLVYGHDGFAGECGHIVVVPDGRLCGCGGLGHLEAYCSAPGIARTVFELLAKYNKSDSELAGIPFNSMTSEIVYNAAVKGDEIAREAFEITGELLGRGLATSVCHLSPEAIFLFGGASAAGDLIFKPTKDSMERHVMPVFRNKVKILPSELKAGSAAIVGASALVWKELEKLGA
ncbi:Glucokinase [subsurface metagenome]